MDEEHKREIIQEVEQEQKDEAFWEWMEYNKQEMYKEFVDEHRLEDEFLEFCKEEHRRSL